MSTLKIPLPAKRLMEGNMSVVFQFAFSRIPLEDYRQEHFAGEQENLGLVAFELAEIHATQAFVELAIYLRALDDEQHMSEYVATHSAITFGRVHLKSGEVKNMTLRDVANKVIHGIGYRWQFPAAAPPQFVCDARPGGMPQNWNLAEIEISSLLMFCAMLTPGA